MSKRRNKENDDKFNQYRKDIQNERMFLFRINHFLTEEFEEIIDDILILNEEQFISQLKNRVEREMVEIYSDKILSEKNFINILEKGINNIKLDYKINYDFLNDTYYNYSKNKNLKNNNIEYLNSHYRRHCINEVENEYATHTCNQKLGKFILVKKNGKNEFVICSNCKKVYYSNIILCKCYKCKKKYFTEILAKKEDEFLLPATWDNYHCKLIVNEKIKCIKCHEIIYLNLKTGMLICLNKKCNFISKPSRIVWTCSICQEDFKCGAIPYNPLDLEIIKKIIKQTLFQKQKAHPYKVPCCKLNVFFTEFYHKKKCFGILYTGELNNDIIIVCDKCHAINFYDRFIWTCPKCENKFKDEKDDKENSISEDISDNTGNSYLTISSEGRKKTNSYVNDKNNSTLDEEYSSETYSYMSKNNKRLYLSNKTENNNSIENKRDTNQLQNKTYKKNEEINNISENNAATIEQPRTLKIFYSSRFNRGNQNNNINKKNDKEKEIEIENDNVDNKKSKEESNKYRRIRFYTENDISQNEKEIKEEKEKVKNKNNDEEEQKRKIEKPAFNIFSKYRQKRKMEEKEKQEKERERKEKKDIEGIEKNEKEIKEKERETGEKREIKESKKFPLSTKKLTFYKSFKGNTEKKDDIKYPSSKYLQITENREFNKKDEKKEINKEEKLQEEEEEIEIDDSKNKKRNIINNNIIESNNGKKEENYPSFKERWKFRHPEGKKTLGKVIKEESTNEEKNNSNSKEQNNIMGLKDININVSNNNDNQNQNININNTIQRVPGMCDNLLNHVNKRINSIISKCSIPLMNVEDYIIYKKMGQGSYGIIFSVISKKDKKQYALKKIISNKLNQIGDFTKEFELVHLCNHENIMKIYSFCIRILDQTTYALYVLMELAECDWNKEIKRKLKQRKNYSEKELINILYQLTSGLLYIQEKYHISHRDIKPQNVLVFSDGKYKLADFGEAKEAKISKQINTLRGTELFMSPALYDGLKNEKDDVSHNPFKSDVFSLGFCFLYASALNYNLLYEIRDIMDNKTINLILHKFLNKSYSEKLILLLASMLEIDESKRYDFSEIKAYIENNYQDMINKDN